ncbi:MAG: 50S ribosomal protein L15 [Chlamydiota bacterium]
MSGLHNLSNTSRQKKNNRRVGRGQGSGAGKTATRGQKGAGARAGYRRRHYHIGGGLPLYRKLPTRGFTRGRFQKQVDIINLWQIDELYSDGETVDAESLRNHGLIGNNSDVVKLLANGEISKKVHIKLDTISLGAQQKLQEAGISFEILGQ